MEIWRTVNLKVHNFISESYWNNNFLCIQEVLQNSEMYVYEEQGLVVGYIGLKENYIEGIFVDIFRQHEGIGTKLLNKTKEIRLKLFLSLFKKNGKAIEYYKKNGFKIISE